LSSKNHKESDDEEEEKNGSQDFDLNVDGGARGTRDTSLIKKDKSRRNS
tara:strand:+ start:273 stop:419 length:147 start_codon:yes stop_codon:yes gene_type:complete